MEDEQPIEFEHWGLTGDATGEAGLLYLVSRDDPRLVTGNWCVNLQGLAAADTITGAVTRRCIEVFLARSASQVTIWPPTATTAILNRMHDLLGPLPDRVAWAPALDVIAPVRDRNVIIPATPIGSDSDAELYGEAVGRALMGLHMPTPTVRRTAQAFAELTGNALAARNLDGFAPIASVALDPGANTISVTVIGDPPPLDSSAAAAPFLKSCVQVSLRRRGGWQRLFSKPGANLGIAVGSARATLSAAGEDHRLAAAVDAFCASWTMPIGTE